jgi:hypothetical protein
VACNCLSKINEIRFPLLVCKGDILTKVFIEPRAEISKFELSNNDKEVEITFFVAFCVTYSYHLIM